MYRDLQDDYDDFENTALQKQMKIISLDNV